MSDLGSDKAEVRRLLRLVINAPQKVVTLNPRDMNLAFRIARRARLLGRLAVGIENAGMLAKLPQTGIDQLQSAKATADAREWLARWELERIAWAMQDDPETRLVVLKGCAYLLLDLPNAPGRVFADVDLMTDEDRLEKIEATLNARGWITQALTPYDQNYYRNWTHELPPLTHNQREMEIDLHHNVLPRTARLKPDGRELMRCSRVLPGTRYRVLANADIVLHAMTHLMFADDLADKLRDLVDIGDLVTHFSAEDDAFWEQMVTRAERLDLRRPAWYSLHFIARLLDVSIPESIVARTEAWAPIKPVRLLMQRLVPDALFPQHPDNPGRGAKLSRLLLFVRSHWIRMPPWLLVYHLGYKFIIGRLRSPAAKVA